MEVTRWRKASRSEGVNNCVEVALDAMRDSKNPGAILNISLADLVVAVKTGRLDR